MAGAWWFSGRLGGIQRKTGQVMQDRDPEWRNDFERLASEFCCWVLKHFILVEQELLCGAFIFDTQIKALWLKCAQNSWLLVFSLQQEDRKIGDALDFVNGYRLRNNIAKFEPVGSLQTCENDTKKHHNWLDGYRVSDLWTIQLRSHVFSKLLTSISLSGSYVIPVSIRLWKQRFHRTSDWFPCFPSTSTWLVDLLAYIAPYIFTPSQYPAMEFGYCVDLWRYQIQILIAYRCCHMRLLDTFCLLLFNHSIKVSRERHRVYRVRWSHWNGKVETSRRVASASQAVLATSSARLCGMSRHLSRLRWQEHSEPIESVVFYWLVYLRSRFYNYVVMNRLNKQNDTSFIHKPRIEGKEWDHVIRK